MKKTMALMRIAKTALTICQRKASRWSMKLISDSSFPPVLRRLMNDCCSDKKIDFELLS